VLARKQLPGRRVGLVIQWSVTKRQSLCFREFAMWTDGYVVVGSGPTGIACAEFLIREGAAVTVIDVGRTCEPERQTLINRLRQISPHDWSPAERGEIAPPLRSTPEPGSPRKLVLGSAYPYVPAAEGGLTQEGTNCGMSWAVGGLSNVWGASMLPFTASELSDWPVDISALAEHYGEIEKLVGMTGLRDALEERFPLYTDVAPSLPLSSQAHAPNRPDGAKSPGFAKAGHRLRKFASRGGRGSMPTLPAMSDGVRLRCDLQHKAHTPAAST
jgi:choline dehydrogenase-like flavoprotein